MRAAAIGRCKAYEENFVKHITAASVTWDVCIWIQQLFNMIT